MRRAKKSPPKEIVKPLTITALGRRFHFSNTARQFGFRFDDAGPGRAVLKMKFLEPVSRGTIYAEARVIRLGKYLAVVECDVVDDHGKLVAKALMTFSVGVDKSHKLK